jgi:DNA-binding transcriptional ArsR family regulator
MSRRRQRKPKLVAEATRFAKAAPVFAALGDPTRLGLVAQLSERGASSITSLTTDAQVTRQAITKHLTVLANAGLVTSSWAGRERLWEVAPNALNDARTYLDQVAAQWDDALARLKAFVEDT